MTRVLVAAALLLGSGAGGFAGYEPFDRDLCRPIVASNITVPHSWAGAENVYARVPMRGERRRGPIQPAPVILPARKGDRALQPF